MKLPLRYVNQIFGIHLLRTCFVSEKFENTQITKKILDCVLRNSTFPYCTRNSVTLDPRVSF